jgi:membrane protein implicated in regulation of membrane protease activity
VIEIPVEDFVFVVCALVAGGLLLITVLVDDILGGIFDSLNIDVGGASLMPLLLSFIAMFGVGGLFATQVLDMHGGAAAVVGVLFGLAGVAIAWVMFRFLRSSVSPNPFSVNDLVGTDAYVSVAIPATEWGTVSLKVEGQTHEFRATSDHDIARGTIVRITGVAGTSLLVEPATGRASAADEPGDHDGPAGPVDQQ